MREVNEVVGCSKRREQGPVNESASDDEGPFILKALYQCRICLQLHSLEQ